MIRKLLCRVFGHRWEPERCDRPWGFNPTIRLRVRCIRCGAGQWWDIYAYHEEECFRVPEAKEAPQ